MLDFIGTVVICLSFYGLSRFISNGIAKTSSFDPFSSQDNYEINKRFFHKH